MDSVAVAEVALALAFGVLAIASILSRHGSLKGLPALKSLVPSSLPFTRPRRGPPIEGLPDPDPLHGFVLENATTRNHVYVNKVNEDALRTMKVKLTQFALQTVRFPYFQTMAHQPMHINDWIEIDKDLDWWVHERLSLESRLDS